MYAIIHSAHYHILYTSKQVRLMSAWYMYLSRKIVSSWSDVCMISPRAKSLFMEADVCVVFRRACSWRLMFVWISQEPVHGGWCLCGFHKSLFMEADVCVVLARVCWWTLVFVWFSQEPVHGGLCLCRFNKSLFMEADVCVVLTRACSWRLVLVWF